MNSDLSLNELEQTVREGGMHLDREYGEYSDESREMAAKKALDSFRAVAGHLYAHYGNDRDVKIPFAVFKPFLDMW
jgi:hypothetical protein